MPDAPISLPSLTYERAGVLFNAAAIYASLAAFERRAEAESIKRALGYLTVCLAGGRLVANGRPLLVS